MSKRQGIVYLVGAGPGDPKLITVKGLETLRRAEVVIYDHLVSERLLEQAHPKARLIYVGKAKGWRAKSQAGIDRLLVRYAKAGKIVVRLKGGDPVLFGRAGEEAMALACAKIPFEIVPGLTSAIAVPAYAGIPVTHRQLASSLAIVTGHEDSSKSKTSIHWDKLATATDTLVCLMGVGTLAQTAKQLIRFGRPKDTPCAVIEWGTLPRQRTVLGTLSNIAHRCEQAHLQPPSVVVVGEVVRLRRWLRWRETKVLFGRRILVTRPADRVGHLADMLEALGAEVVPLPAVELVPVKSNGLLRQAIRQIEQFDWVFFTSPEGISWFRRLLRARRSDLRILSGRHIGAIGPKTQDSIEQLGIHVDFTPKTYSQEGMLNELKTKSISGKRALILSAEGSRDVLEQGLKAAGMRVMRAGIYRVAMPKTLLGRVRSVFREPLDYVTVTSSSCVDHLVQAMRACGLAGQIGHLAFASIGPVTSAAVRQCGGKVAVEARSSTVEELVEAIVAAGP